MSAFLKKDWATALVMSSIAVFTAIAVVFLHLTGHHALGMAVEAILIVTLSGVIIWKAFPMIRSVIVLIVIALGNRSWARSEAKKLLIDIDATFIKGEEPKFQMRRLGRMVGIMAASGLGVETAIKEVMSCLDVLVINKEVKTRALISFLQPRNDRFPISLDICVGGTQEAVDLSRDAEIWL
jgi:hypothetical protein